MKGTSTDKRQDAQGPIPKDGQTKIESGVPPGTKPRRTDKGRFADGTIKVVPDMSAEERFIARSLRIRKKIKSWLTQNVGERWPTLGALHRDCANYCDASMNTVSRWVYQFTGPGQEWQLIEHEDDYELAFRLERRE